MTKRVFKSEEFHVGTALLAALALSHILARRVHKRVVFGEERLVAGTLGEAVKLPSITHCLKHRSSKQRAQGLEDFKLLWDTLSLATCQTVLDDIGWYKPQDLDWEDIRSNRRPDISED
ncbi:MAG: hypothetical protein VB957_00975 [Pseudomonadales bacterium]|jgi:hypothetical protein